MYKLATYRCISSYASTGLCEIYMATFNEGTNTVVKCASYQGVVRIN